MLFVHTDHIRWPSYVVVDLLRPIGCVSISADFINGNGHKNPFPHKVVSSHGQLNVYKEHYSSKKEQTTWTKQTKDTELMRRQQLQDQDIGCYSFAIRQYFENEKSLKTADSDAHNEAQMALIYTEF